ncbi:MAG: phosphotransferase [Clostridia bacterium]|nr:phosphotransferase [Clostridia bacterium]
MNYNLNNEIASKNNKNVYRDGDKTIKLYVENYSKANVLNEALNQARVEEGTDLKIPKLIEVAKIGERWGIVSNYIEGKTLKTLMEENPEKLDEYLEMFVDIQLEVLDHEVPLLNRIKDKFKRKLTEAKNLDEATRFELLHRLSGMEDHNKLCHGDFNPANIIVTNSGEHYIIDWAHVTQGNASADSARTFLIFSLHGREEIADKYLTLFSEKSGIPKTHIQRWIPIVAATQLLKEDENHEMLNKWIDVVDYQ